MIVHITHFYCYESFDIWYRINLQSGKLFLMKVCKLSVCKEPTLYQTVHENGSETLLHSLFLHKTVQLSPFALQSTVRCPPFYKLVTSIAFSMNYSIHSHVCNNRYCDFTILNGMIKRYDISCAHPVYGLNRKMFATRHKNSILSKCSINFSTDECFCVVINFQNIIVVK